ncbi:hypothetical protein [Rhizobium leucaenae]|uniref:hypothetical protein n=1 Tax=Rhizobium leucaenae TaxID=29450 RepID=UPI0016111DEF|nr:hypothetical protein [Rhizobium leucaenae]MBB6304044.1 hypothetical protein [Rhizobium leucaenae]
MDADFKHLAVEFFDDPVHNPRKSAEEGRTVYDNVEKVRIRIAGDRGSEFVGLANEGSSVRDPITNQRLTYAELHFGPYEAFKRGQQYVGDGTRLAELPFISAAKRKELEACHVFTAEALASLDGANLAKLGMGARELKNQATAWLEKAAGSADIVRLAGENEALRAQMEQMQAQLAALMKGSVAEQKSPANSVASEYDVNASPFFDWDDETIRLWIEEQGGDKPHHKCGHETLVQKADELNAALQERTKEAA